MPSVINRHHYPEGLPAGAIYIGRGTPLGNPYTLDQEPDRRRNLALYRDHLVGRVVGADLEVLRALERIAPDSALVCSCAPRPCHGHVILDVWRQYLLAGEGLDSVGWLPRRALTLWPEWAHAVAWLGKDVENRGWRSSRTGWLAIHAGKHVGGRPGATSEGMAALWSMARRAGVSKQALSASIVERSAIVAVAKVVGFTQSSSSPWAVPGQVAWELERVIPLAEPIPCPGARSLWTIEPDHRALLLERLVGPPRPPEPEPAPSPQLSLL